MLLSIPIDISGLNLPSELSVGRREYDSMRDFEIWLRRHDGSEILVTRYAKYCSNVYHVYLCVQAHSRNVVLPADSDIFHQYLWYCMLDRAGILTTY